MRTINSEDLDDLAVGAAILGSGGGGDPSYELLMAKEAFERFGAVNLIKAEELSDEDLIVPVGFMGAPLVTKEKIPSGREFLAVIKAVERYFGKRPAAIMSAEIGGGNAFAPLLVAGQLGLPVVDADTLGRAFPQLQMSTCNLFGIRSTPAFLADAKGQCVTIEAMDSFTVEKYARSVVIAMGSSAAIGFYLMKGKEVAKATVTGSVSYAIELGKSIRFAKKAPIEALLEASKGRRLGSGMIVDVTQEVKDGFLEGTFTINDSQGEVVVKYQNEYLLACHGKKTLAVTPEIIIPLEQESAFPITSESLRYGLRVDLLALPAPEVWTTEKGLQLVGPEVFGYV